MKTRFSLTKEDFKGLVLGNVIKVENEHDGCKAEICLQDIGYGTMRIIIEQAMRKDGFL